MTGKLHCQLLGTPLVTYAGTPLTDFISTKAQALLYYLASTGEQHSRDHLATLFWGHMPTPAARKNLTKALSNLRKMIGDTLVADRNSAKLRSECVTADLHTFHALLQHRSTATLGSIEPFPADRIWQADGLYRGLFLQDLMISDAPDFELWLEGMRAECRQVLLETLDWVAEQATAAAETETALALTDRALHHDPTWEVAHRRKMTLLARLGNSAQLLKQYEQCRAILAQELGVEPDVETTHLFQTLQAAQQPTPHNLPAATTPFVGREAELLALQSLLCGADCRLLTITGAGGVGKTRLALQLAEEYSKPHAVFDPQCTFPDGIYFLALTSLDHADTVIALLAEQLGFTFYDEGNVRQQLLDAMQHKRMLLVLDNVEHLVATADNQPAGWPEQATNEFLSLIVELLAGSPSVKFVMTSRTRLNMQGERLYSISGLHYPVQALISHEGSVSADDDFATLASIDREYSAIQLFVQSARRLQPQYVLLDQDWPAVVRICQLVEGMPLGILLAAAWMDIYTPAEIADEIGLSLDFLEADLPDLPPRQRSIRAAIDYSWRLLDPAEQRLFQRLSLFRGSFSRHAARQIAEATPHLLQSLVKKSLLQPIVHGRFLLHELLRQYATEIFAAEEEAYLQSRTRHSHYFADATTAWAAALKDERQQQTLKAMDLDSENLRIAWQWLVANGDDEGQLAMVNGLCQFYLWRGRYQEGMETVEPALQRLPFIQGENDPLTVRRLQLLLATWHGHFLRLLGRLDDAQTQLEAALAQLQDHEQDHGQPQEETIDLSSDLGGESAFIWLQLGNTLRETDRQRAQHCYTESLAAYRANDDPWGAANALAALGWLIQHWGAYPEASRIYEESLDLRQRLRDQRGIAGCLRALGGITLYQGNHREAEQLIRRSIAIHGEMDDQAGIAAGLGKLGETLTLLGQAEDAVDPLQESIGIYRTLGLQDDEMFAQAVLAHTWIHLGQYGTAAHHAQRAAAYFQRANARRGIAYTTLIEGWAQLAQSAWTPAEALLQQSATIYADIGQLDELGQAQALLGICAYHRGDHTQAQELYEQAQATATAIQAFMPLTLAHLLAKLLSYSPIERANPRPTPNSHQYTEFTAHPLVQNSNWFAALLAG